MQSQYLSFDEAFEVFRPKQAALKQREYLKQGLYPVIDQGANLVGGYSDEESLLVHLEQPVIVFGDHTKCVKWVNFKFVVGADGTKILGTKKQLDPRFAYFQLLSKELASKGYARHFALLRKEAFWAPPLDVQKRIVETLEDHLSRLDKALSEVQFGRNLLSLERRALLHSAFVGELFEDTRAERVTQTLLGWDQKSLYEITLRNVQKIDPANLGRESFRYIEIGSFELHNGRIVAPTPIPTKGAPSRARQQIAHGDTVFSTVRPYMRKIGIVGSDLDGEIASTGFCVLRPDTNQVLPEYLALLSKSDVVLDQVLPLQRGASYPAVSDKDILSAQVFIPPLEVQKQIVESLEDHLSRLDKTSQTLDLVEHEANQLRRSLLHSAFTGQLTNEDSND